MLRLPPCLRTALILLLLLPLNGCIRLLLKPGRDFEKYTPPPAPDYAQASSWAALPTKKDSADAVPRHSTLRDEQATAAVDVFFIHPTTYYSPRHWNGDVRKKWLNKYTDRTTIKQQASVFNATGRIYAPRYRQATLFSFLDKEPNGEKALELAYSDVRSAFQYYLAHFNQGRAFIIASHSQGTDHATRLLHEFFDKPTPLRRQLVAAYLIGFQVKPNEFTTLKPCADSLATDCYVAYNTSDAGHESSMFQPSIAVNPLTWTLDSTLAPASLNRGAVSIRFKHVHPNFTDAQIHHGQLWVHAPRFKGFPHFPPSGKKKLRYSRHIADYALFYMNIRENSKARVRAWQKSKD
ncbi:DUF3089 domain-containing protein [Hymenobacter negativus]|uniref:DUF3089 domain-containing protein n=1 Tax=Hymenobacter negativus TaxID=2795026 RepID=A0ABS0QAS4_9BACT|nr:DUF3089 domain-containing protein [Hymenobacter negativus]MBH8559725.1 DUF3089 domain-containing protein [Hymenobacter negativus]